MKIEVAEKKNILTDAIATAGGVTFKVQALDQLQSVLRLIRVKHWVKNLFLFIPSFFAGHLFNTSELLRVGIGALAFSLVASGVYVINDLRDRKVDKHHPRKKFRPLASGEVRSITALVLISLLIPLGLAVAAWMNVTFLCLLAGYLVLNLGYSFGLKNIPILDLFIVALGFLIRVYSGGVIAGLEITHWLSLMILLLALFLIVAKRRDDLLVTKSNGKNGKNGNPVIRKSSARYNLVYINSCVTLLSAVMVVAYIMYSVSPEVTQRFESDYLFITSVFVIAGIMRYLQIVFVERNSGSPTRIFIRDKFILFTLVGWIITFYLIIYAT